MAARRPTQASYWGSVAALLAGAGAVASAPPEGAPRPTGTIEVYVGTTKVVPQPTARDTKAEDQAGAPEPEPVRCAPVVRPAGAWSAGWPEAPPVQPTVVVIRESERPTPPQMVPAPPPPAVVVVREAEARPATPEPAPAARSNTDWLLLGVGLVGGLAVALMARTRSSVTPAAPFVPVTAPAPIPAPTAATQPEPQTLKLSDGSDVGPPPSTAQKFDVGPSYQDERKVKEQQEEAKGAAVLEFILGQNLALRDRLDAEPPTAPAADGPRAQTQPPAAVPEFLTGVLLPFPAGANTFAAR